MKKHKACLLLFIAFAIFSGCLSRETKGIPDLYSYIPATASISGFWHAANDEIGKAEFIRISGLKASLVNRIEYAAFGYSSEHENSAVAAVSGNWSASLVKWSFSWSKEWEKNSTKNEPLQYYSSTYRLWALLLDEILIISNYSYLPFSIETIKTQSALLSDTGIDNNYNTGPILHFDISEYGIPATLKKLKTTSMSFSIYNTIDNIHTGSLDISFNSPSTRKIMTPLIKLALIPIFFEPGSKLPQTSSSENILSVNDMQIPYQKLLDKYLPMVLKHENMVSVENKE